MRLTSFTRLFAGLLAALCALALPRAVRADIPAGPDAPATAQWRQRAIAFDAKTSADIYKTHAPANPWDDAAVRFILDCDRENRGGVTEPAPAALVKRGGDLYAQGCRDPLVLYLYGLACGEAKENKLAENFVRQGADGIIKAGYPANWAAFADKDAMLQCKARNEPTLAKRYFTAMVPQITDLFKNALYGADRAVLLHDIYLLVTPLSGSQTRDVYRAVKGIPGIDPVALLFIEGEMHNQLAWESRGGGWASQVTQKGWEGYQKENDLARAALQKAWELDKTLPEAAEIMISVEIGNPAMRTWFDRTVAARFDFKDAYDAYLMGIYPRWGGDRDTLLAFGNECAQTARYDTFVPGYFLDALLAIRNECDDGDVSSWATPAIYDTARMVFEKTLAPGGAQAGSRRFRSMEAAFDVCANHWKDARQSLAQLGGKMDPSGARYFGLSGADVVGPILAYTGPDAAPALAGADAAAAGKLPEAIASYQAALKTATRPPAIRFLRGALQSLQWRSDFAAGKDVSLQPDKALSGYHVLRGRWSVDADGALVANAGADATLYLFCDADFGTHWEFYADVTFTKVGENWVRAGITLGAPGHFGLDGDPAFMGFGIEKQKNNFVATDIFNDDLAQASINLKRTNALVVRRDGADLTVLLNGQSVFHGQIADADAHHARLGFGGFPVSSNTTAIRYTHLHIRPLPSP